MDDSFVVEEKLALAEEQWQVPQIVMERFAGEIPINRLFEEIKNLGIEMSRHRLIEFAQQLETLGWVTPGGGNNGRRCTDALIDRVAWHFADE